MTDAMYELLMMIEIITSVVFYFGILILFYRYIEVRKIKQ